MRRGLQEGHLQRARGAQILAIEPHFVRKDVKIRAVSKALPLPPPVRREIEKM